MANQIIWHYYQIPEPLVFHQAANDDESILEELKQKHHRATKRINVVYFHNKDA
jgi:hypothetical protein